MHQLAIVIPAYKATYLNETLESIAQQTDKRFQLYIGDDCSPFDIEGIVKRFQGRIPLIYKRFDTNLGGQDLVGQWERCIELTQNEQYIWLFSDDDTMESSCVELFYNALEHHPKSELFHFNINVIDSRNGNKSLIFPKFPTILSAGEYLKLKLKGKIVSFVVEFIFSRDIYNKVNGFQNFDLAWGSDFMTWLKMASVSMNGILTVQENQRLVNWRMSSENISPNKTKPIMLRKIKALISNAIFLKRELDHNSSSYSPCTCSFKWLQFPLREIIRNRCVLSHQEVRMLCELYYHKVGYPVQAFTTYIITLLYKEFSKIRHCLTN